VRKGINSIDAFLAITIMLFISFWLQNMFNLNFDISQDYGVRIGLKAEAIRVGNAMNTFLANRPSSNDYLVLNGSISMFSDNLTVIISNKSLVNTNASLNVTFKNTLYTASFPVFSGVLYDNSTQKVTK